MSPADLEPLALIAAEVAAEWGLELGPPFALARYSYVAPVGEDAVLKVTPAEDDEADEEPDALALWDGDGAVRLLRRDRERRAVLIERARPGNDISEIPEDEATRSQSPSGRASGGRRRSRSAGSATTFRTGSTERSAPTGKGATSSHWRVSSTARSRSAARRSSTATSTTTTSFARATDFWRSMRRRCSASRSTTSRRSSGIRSGRR